jgi:hypothetical protein
VSTGTKFGATKEKQMTRPESLFEAASYDLNKFRERRMAERRATPRNTADRRAARAPAQDDKAAGQFSTGQNQGSAQDGQ